MIYTHSLSLSEYSLYIAIFANIAKVCLISNVLCAKKGCYTLKQKYHYLPTKRLRTMYVIIT